MHVGLWVITTAGLMSCEIMEMKACETRFSRFPVRVFKRRGRLYAKKTGVLSFLSSPMPIDLDRTFYVGNLSLRVSHDFRQLRTVMETQRDSYIKKR